MANAAKTKVLSTPLLFLMAAAISATAANLYYNQPLLPLIGESFGVEGNLIGLIPAASQLGYAFAILLISPLGDTMIRRNLIGYLSFILTLALLAVCLAPNFAVLVTASFVIGLGANITQQLIPFGAALSTEHTRGKNMGTLMTGLTVGILLSRTISGFIAEHFGWRSVFFFAALLAALFGVMLRKSLPFRQPSVSLSYVALMGSMFTMIKKHRLLRASAFTGALWFAAFNAMWATLAMHVVEEPFLFNIQQAGMLGLVGLAGIFGAKLSGHLVKNIGAERLIAVALFLIASSFGVLAFWGDSLIGLIAGIILLDLGVFGAQIPNQVRVFSIDPDAQSRMNAMYMLSYYTAAAIGSAVGTKVMSIWGWSGVTVFGFVLSVVAIAYHLFFQYISQDAAKTLS
jgi:predicted MFS family arabinose efflux permease